MQLLTITVRRQNADGSAVETVVQYPGALPKDLANLLNVTGTVNAVVAALGAMADKARVEAKSPEVIAEMERYKSALGAVVGLMPEAIPEVALIPEAALISEAAQG